MNYYPNLLIICCCLVLGACAEKSSSTAENMDVPKNTNTAFDWQGHRGARGLLPENTIPAFLKALSYPIQTLELDVAISKDGQVVVSHDPWMKADICFQADGTSFEDKKGDPQYKIIEMDYAEIARFNCGKKLDRFPEQEQMEVAKPLLKDVILAAEAYCKENNRALPFYNIEIKSKPSWDSNLTPLPDRFAELVITLVKEQGIKKRTCIQSFDPRSIEAVHAQAPEITTAFLVENIQGMKKNLERLSYQPEIYSPYHKLVNQQTIELAKSLGMKIIPWTVNTTEEMQKLKDLGVDGIITDYPDRIPF